MSPLVITAIYWKTAVLRSEKEGRKVRGIHLGLSGAYRLAIMSDPEMLRADFKPTGERYVLAARISGKVPSAFPEGLPAPPGSPPATHGDHDCPASQSWISKRIPSG